MISGDHLWILALALILDAIGGDPDWLWRRVPHPVVAMGALIAALDRRWNREDMSSDRRRTAGILALVLVAAIAAAIGWIVESVFASADYGWILTVIVAAVMLAGRGLYDHVAGVAAAYEAGGIAAARRAVASIVGRDAETLDESGVSRAAIESAAENFSDGLVAPAFWFALLGLPGLLAYKAINTADSMIGYRTPRHRHFGWASARLDDVVNWVPARLSAVVIALAAPFAGGSVGVVIKVMAADAPHHRSPNAGWPEAAMAAALGVALGGARHYGGVAADDPFLNASGRAATAADICRALRVYAGAWVLFFLPILLIGALLLA